ncbi:MAG: penicillin-binding protein [Bdellovibrionales bacterium RIFCSPHIGHO2_01_FULL_40_29]|nr:MAG: penicillin-binding protein [Bdellovibrionales bacterium RIFCSPHIGHO2_01_FULL_40_29]OFZ35115.1 MAG: penicillin-binding protein [Bdellovibrionales bacterium RIFCSPHIGHO2_02_FULL_40_15]
MMVPFALLLTAFLFFNEKTTPETEDEWLKKTLDARLTISNSLSPLIKANKKPESGDFAPDGESEKRNLKINYTFDQELQKESETLLKRYKPDYAAIFMMDAKTGKILAMSSFEKANSQGSNLNLRATFPAASIFKIITASAAVDKAGVSPEHRIGFNGGNYTLYKKNVLSDKVNKWTRFITLKEAFARSINTAFGRLSLENLEPHDLKEYAQRFMFNQTIPTDFEVETSQATIPTEKGFAMTEVASGFNRFNTLSPVHGAMIAASVINDGKMIVPYLVESLEDSNSEKIYQAKVLERGQILRPESAEKVRQMMEQTVLSGTSRKTFRKLVRDKKFKEVEMGGKTGHFTGMNPRGRTDWFVGYATDQDDKIAIAAVTVNIRKWTVKSSALGEMMFRKYFKERLEEKRAAKANAALKNRG